MKTVSDVLEQKGTEVAKILPDALLGHAVEELDRYGIGVLLVIDDSKRLVGIISERDIISGLAAGRSNPLHRRVETLMKVAVQTCAPTAKITEALTVMEQHHIRHLPVVDDDNILGIISMRDLMYAVLDATRMENDDLGDMNDLMADMVVVDG